MKKHGNKYPQNDAFHLAPNAGIMDDKGIKRTAEDHGSDMPDFGIGHVTQNAMRKDWHSDHHVMRQDGNGSMNYMSEKNHIAGMDAKKIGRTFKKIGEAV